MSDDLTHGQADGLVCVVFGTPFAETDEPAVPAGHGPRGQVFACERHRHDETPDAEEVTVEVARALLGTDTPSTTEEN